MGLKPDDFSYSFVGNANVDSEVTLRRSDRCFRAVPCLDSRATDLA